MKKILEAIWKFLNSKFFGYAVAIILILLLAGQCKRNTDLRRENRIQEQNIAAANDSIRTYKNRNGELTSEKAIWILTEKQLKEENKTLYDRVKAQNGQIISLNHTILALRQDTTILHDSIRYLNSVIGKAIQLDDVTWKLPWELNYRWDSKGINWDQFKGHTIVGWDSISQQVIHRNTLLDYRTGNIELTFGEKVVDNKYNVYITTSYPGLSVKSLEGFFVDPNSNKYIKSLIKKDHWFTGFGIGPNASFGYNPLLGKPVFSIGIGLHYNIYQW